jgi:SAM-dependent methyltransferase
MPELQTANPAPAGSHLPTAGASEWVKRWLRSGGGRRLLDFACGSGRHALLARELGYSVTAADRDPSAVARLQAKGIHVVLEDLETRRWPFAGTRFDVVVCTSYLFRPRLDLLCGLPAAGGLLLYETFAVGNARYGRPSNPDYLLRPGELASAVQRAGLHLLAYEDGFTAVPRPARIQRAAAVRPPFDPQDLPLD